MRTDEVKIYHRVIFQYLQNQIRSQKLHIKIANITNAHAGVIVDNTRDGLMVANKMVCQSVRNFVLARVMRKVLQDIIRHTKKIVGTSCNGRFEVRIMRINGVINANLCTKLFEILKTVGVKTPYNIQRLADIIFLQMIDLQTIQPIAKYRGQAVCTPKHGLVIKDV